ncbi:hypothetical protein M9Y10_035801 [Tritrichomonas musculus]|uniref:Guanylate cyclase domain-containing protein n=1 Tax=Tritrichomonas musculus TaxID=1915356 RepID=A0ABR2GVA0_9EUKA
MYENIGTMANEMLNNLDEIIFGNNDTVESGILYSTKEVQKLLFQLNSEPYGDGDTMDTFIVDYFPHYIGFEFFYESNLKFVEETLGNPYFNSIIGMVTQTFDMGYIFDSVRLGTFSIIPLFLDVYVIKINDQFFNSIDKIVEKLFLLGSIIFIIGFIAVSWLIVMILNVKKNIQFTYSLLSMIDPVYYQDMQNVMNLFYGKTSGSIQINQNIQRTFNEIESHVPECPLELNGDLYIVSISDQLIEMWNLNEEHVIGSHMKYILTFKDESIYNQLARQANGSITKAKPINHCASIIINDTKKEMNVDFTSYYVSRNKNIKLVLMFKDTLNMEKETISVEEMTERNNDIKTNMIPEKLRSKIDLNSDIKHFSSHYLFFTAIEIMSMKEYMNDHAANETRKYFKNFENKIIEACNSQENDICYLKKIGNVFIVGFNFVQQKANFYNPAQVACDFVKNMNSYALSNHYVIRSGAVTSKSASTILMDKNTFKFDIYSNKIKALLLLLKSGLKYDFIIPQKMKSFIPLSMQSNFNETEIVHANMKSERGYKFYYE